MGSRVNYIQRHKKWDKVLVSKEKFQLEFFSYMKGIESQEQPQKVVQLILFIVKAISREISLAVGL